MKTQLTPVEAVKCYLASREDGIDQHKLSFLYGVNVGRVSEAIQAVEWTANNILRVYHLSKEEEPK
jgi:predicted transcriptional regulator